MRDIWQSMTICLPLHNSEMKKTKMEKKTLQNENENDIARTDTTANSFILAPNVADLTNFCD